MTEARIEAVPADPREARVFLARGKDFLRDGRAGDNTAASRQVLLHSAAVCACDAVLLAAGLRVTAGDRSHVIRLDKATELLDADDLLDRLDDARLRRNESSYGAAMPAAEDVAEAIEVTQELLDRASAFVADAMD